MIRQKIKSKIYFKLNLFNFNKKRFSEDQRYNYNYEAPEEQNLDLKTIGIRFLRRLAITCTLSYITYIFLFRKYNELSKSYKFVFINEYFEMHLANYVSNTLKSNLKNSIYKQDSDESKLVLKIYKQILEHNKINLPIDYKNIYVIDSISFGAFLNLNGDLFISNRIIELADGDENELALFIGVELSSVLMGNFFNRILKYFIYDYLGKDFNITQMKTKNFFTYKIDKLNKINRFLYFYPESLISTYYEEVELLQHSIRLLKKANFNVFQAVEVLKKFEEKIKYYPRHYTENIFVNKESRFYEGAKNYLKIYLIDNKL